MLKQFKIENSHGKKNQDQNFSGKKHLRIEISHQKNILK